MVRPPDGRLTWDPNALAGALCVLIEDVREYCTDGRRFSFIVERRIARDILHGSLAPSEGASFDVVDPQGRKWEVRSITKSGVYFCPSYMVGSSRSFEERGSLQKLDEIEGYVLADLTCFPGIPFWYVTAATVLRWWNEGRLGTTTKISQRRALALIHSLGVTQ